MNTLDVAGTLSWIFLLGIFVKVVSTVVGVKHRASPFLPPGMGDLVWWLSKLSALLVCICAFALSWLGDDTGAMAIFGGLFLLAVSLVSLFAMKRIKGEGPGPSL
ncbi:hypothetical protein LNV09_02620 [Paucibacter sp. B2R-40]|uniref:hypothetical protein n=1 Tax=Paucibacter sp. B2R-40 TaxID=2893554 RepID=UPI0021E4BFF6|nr:hypothetical protein [Paucibacter sp. B2R-40]MCV2353050.1 hypothetical protein [Paucibacter sp. B2R-40]